jgi:homocitrate synthase NifV
MDVRIVDITLRAAEQLTGKAIKTNQKIHLARLLDSIGIYQLEAGIPALGPDARKSMTKVAEAGLKCKISSWNRLALNDIRTSMGCGMDIVHISVPSSNMQISSKLNKTKGWILEYLKKCIYECRTGGFAVTVGLEDASRAERDFLYALIDCAVAEGAERIRYTDTAGLLFRTQAYEELHAIREKFDVQLEMSAHNELGMAVANSVAAVKAGATYTSCTAAGIGPGAGYCSLAEFIRAAVVFLGACSEFDLEQVKEVQKNVISLIKY